MTGKDLLHVMNYLEEEIVEQSLKTSCKAQIKDVATVHNLKSGLAKTALKWVAAAAASMLFFGSGVAYATKYGIIRTNPGWESGYRVDITSRRVTEEEFSEEVRAVKQELLQDIAVAEDSENTPVFGWIQDFDTVEETIAFIGHKNLKTPSFPGTLDQTGVVVLGNNNADILYTRAFARYSFERIWASISCCMYTDAFSYETSDGIKNNGLQYADEIYITAKGKEAFLIYPTEYTGNHGIQGYLVDDSVVYELCVSGYDKDIDRIVRLMKEWLDKF